MSNRPVDTSYWNKTGPRQELYDRLWATLIPEQGHSDTVEGELLRCFGWMAHDAYNNGGGNNYSGALLFVRKNLPDFKREWYETLYEVIVDGRLDDTEARAIEAMGEAILDHLVSKEGNYSPNAVDFRKMNAEYLDNDGPARRPMTFWNDDDDEYEDRYGL